MDESMEAFASKDVAFGMRVFDAGEFHVGFGIAAPSDDETTEFSVEGVARNGRTPFRHRSPLLCTAIALAAARRSVWRRKKHSRHCLRGWLNWGRVRAGRMAQDQRCKECERGSTNRGRPPVPWCRW